MRQVTSEQHSRTPRLFREPSGMGKAESECQRMSVLASEPSVKLGKGKSGWLAASGSCRARHERHLDCIHRLRHARTHRKKEKPSTSAALHFSFFIFMVKIYSHVSRRHQLVGSAGITLEQQIDG